MIKIHNNFIDLCKYNPIEDAEKLSALLSFGKFFYTWDKQYDSIINELDNKNSEKNSRNKKPNQDVKPPFPEQKTRTSFKNKIPPKRVTKKPLSSRQTVSAQVRRTPNPVTKKPPIPRFTSLDALQPRLKKLEKGLNILEKSLHAQNLEACEKCSSIINRTLSAIPSYASAAKASSTLQVIKKRYDDLCNLVRQLKENQKDPDEARLEKELSRIQPFTNEKILENESISTHEMNTDYSLALFSNETRSNENDDDEILLKIGFDIGTSFTKVIIYDQWCKNVFYPVDFQCFSAKNNPFLLPTRLSITKNGQYFIPLSSENNASFTNLKLDFIQSESPEIIPFIALVIQYVRTWFIQKYADIDAYRNHSLVWFSIRSGVPFASCSQKGSEARFESALQQAHELSHKEAIFEQDILQPLASEQPLAELKCFPEIKAEIKTYETSFSREDDLHLAIDIGAGTLDCSLFIIDQQLPNKPFSVVSSIMPFLGAKIYEKFLSDALPKDEDHFDTTSDVKDLNYFLEKYDNQQIRDELNKRHDFFVKKCAITINTLISFVKKKVPNNLRVWKQPLTVLLLGGGRHIQVYQDVVQKIFCPYNLKSIHRQIPYIGNKLYNLEQERMFVAQGLCLDEIDYQDMYYPEDFDDYGNVKTSLTISKNGCYEDEFWREGD